MHGPDSEEDESAASDIGQAWDELHTEGEAEPAESTEPVATETAAKEPATTDKAATAKTNGKEPPETTTNEWDRPPSGLTIEEKGAWKTWPEATRKAFVRREADFHKGLEEYKSGHNFAREVVGIMKPYEPIIKAEGGNFLGAIENLIQTAYELRQDPAGTLSRLAQMYQVDMGKLPQQQAVDPNTIQMQQRIAQLESYIQQGMQGQQQQAISYAQTELQKFLSDPSHVYYDDVKDDMALLLSQGRATDLKDAYDKAVWMNPKVREAVKANELRDAEQKRLNEAKQRAANAKRASFDVSGSGSPVATTHEMSQRDEIAALMG